MPSRRNLLQATAAAAVAATGLGIQAPAWSADTFPSKPIRVVVPFAPGSGTDTSARHVARHLQQLTGQAVIVDNKPGGNGFLAVNQVLAAPADGYTILIGSSSLLTVNPALFKTLPYDPVADLTPLGMVLRAPIVLVVPANSPYKDLGSLLAAARANPDRLNYGSGSPGYRLMTEMFNENARIQVTHVPFKSAVDAIAAVAGGTVDMAFADITSILEMVKGGRVRALTIATEKRSPLMPELPTADELGVKGYTASFWSAALVSSKTPQPEVDKLSALVQQIVALPDTYETFGRIGAEQMVGGPADVRARQTIEIPQWKRVAARIKMEPQ